MYEKMRYGVNEIEIDELWDITRFVFLGTE